jgi:hypothetical protein
MRGEGRQIEEELVAGELLEELAPRTLPAFGLAE